MLRVSEVFAAPQGEGARVGEQSVFVRLSGCSAKNACFESGVRCDTEFESGTDRELDELLALVKEASATADWVIWTGGEPLDQLTPEAVRVFRDHGYRQAIETSGVRPFTKDFRELFDWIACSPKVAEHVLVRHFGDPGVMLGVPALIEPHLQDGSPNVHRVPVRAHVHELRYVRHKGQGLPEPKLVALHRFLSPHSDGYTLNDENVRHVLGLVAAHPLWKISVQAHKVWRTL